MKRTRQNFGGPAFALVSTGGLIFCIVCMLTVQDLSDDTIRRIFLPGLIMGLPFMVAGLIWHYWGNRERRQRRVLKSDRL